MKPVLSIFICLLLLSTALKDLVIVGFYYGNIDYITDAFCINKEKINTTCKGQCHLTKCIANKSTKEKDIPFLKSMEEKANYLLESSTPLLNTNFKTIKIKPFCSPKLNSIHIIIPLTPPPQLMFV